MTRILPALLLTAAILPAAAQDTPTNTATVLFKSTGDAMNVIFHTTSSAEACEGLTRTAGVYDAELLKKHLLPFIAKMQQKARSVTKIYPQVEVQVKADAPLQVLGQSNWADSNKQMTTFGECGPFTQQFQPQAGHKYLALFKFEGKTCSQSIQDITDEAAPAPVEVTALECKRPMFQ